MKIDDLIAQLNVLRSDFCVDDVIAATNRDAADIGNDIASDAIEIGVTYFNPRAPKGQHVRSNPKGGAHEQRVIFLRGF